MASISESTLKQYSSGLKLWWEYCSTKKADPYSVSVVTVLEFLTYHFKKGASYSSLNTYRSAIAQVAGRDLAQDYRIQKFFKGVYMLRPSLPKYQNTWDPAVVLNFLREWKNKDITLRKLNQKLVTLLALATGQRLQTLALIEITHIYKSEIEINIAVPQRIKTSGKDRSQPFFHLPFLNSDPEVCVARVILTYLEKTENLRGSETSLILTSKMPYRKASTQTLSRWIKIILEKSGIDVHKFSAHSTRHAATSAAKRKGLNMDTIRLSAGWSRDSRMFAQVYNRPLLSDQRFAEAVLTC
ncbi:unnamed protein product [Acanthoscelides obtectus]|uniref:Tyr recombinase domain-containing protein n=1 Tax=Acanthoscelides obtectus TaxID=200917 RepID=A0A9P0L493_ACAOB|nr:unnamed protein product [Acanthoscelides obtectus]CAK1646871.1 hypothetical protein AOBTE_LOCUS14905 [Acanthoscelides obtectus]